MSRLINPRMPKSTIREQLLERALLRLMLKHGYTFFRVPFKEIVPYQKEGYMVRFKNFDEGDFDVSIDHKAAL